MANQEKSSGFFQQDPKIISDIEAAVPPVVEGRVSNPEPPPSEPPPDYSDQVPPDIGSSEPPPGFSDPGPSDIGGSDPLSDHRGSTEVGGGAEASSGNQPNDDAVQPEGSIAGSTNMDDESHSEEDAEFSKRKKVKQDPNSQTNAPTDKSETNTSSDKSTGKKTPNNKGKKTGGEKDAPDTEVDEKRQKEQNVDDPASKDDNKSKTDPFSMLVNLLINMMSALINGILKVVGMAIDADIPKIPKLGDQESVGIASGISEELNHKQALKDQIKNSQENTQTQKGSESPDDGNEASKLDQLNKYLGDQVASIKYDISTLGQFSIGIDDTAEVVDALARNELKRSDSGMLSTLSIATMDDAADRDALLKFASADGLAEFYRVKVGLEGKIEKILGEKDVILAAGDDATRSLVDEVEIASKVLMGVNIETPETTFQTEPGLKAEESKVNNILEDIEKEAGLKVEQSGRSSSKKASQGMS